ncbi:unnamed protein product [Prunus armeniaca]|uniref:Uncharacterized protein n=1 Tax=Prunus armeniaca TaxID=36596 RepID=A0A6J5VXY7_PRUAR|nr:unnamed protein product [Prunus armeniaca]
MGGSREVDEGPSNGKGGPEPPSMGERGGMESEEGEGNEGPERGVRKGSWAGSTWAESAGGEVGKCGSAWAGCVRGKVGKEMSDVEGGIGRVVVAV